MSPRREREFAAIVLEYGTLPCYKSVPLFPDLSKINDHSISKLFKGRKIQSNVVASSAITTTKERSLHIEAENDI